MENAAPENRPAVKQELIRPDALLTDDAVSGFLRDLFQQASGSAVAAALLPWVCDKLPSVHSRRAYGRDLAQFVTFMREQGIDPLLVQGDHVRLFKEALQRSGAKPTTIGRMLSVIRGTYRQFAAKGLVPHDSALDIQAVTSPRVTKNTTPALSEGEARRLLHAPDITTAVGSRDFALLFTFFVTACRVAALVNAKVGDLERTDTNWYLVVTEKGAKRQRKALLQAADAVIPYATAAGIVDDPAGPLFRPVARDRRSYERRPMSSRAILSLVKSYCRSVGIDPDRLNRRGVCVHSLRKTALTNALEHGAKMEQVQALAGHSDIRTTQLYYQAHENDAEDAARHIQIR